MSVTRPAFFRSLIAPFDSAYAQRVFLADSAFITNATLEYAREQKSALVPFYDSLATFFRRHRQAIEATHADDRNVAVLARQTAVSMATFVQQLANGPDSSGIALRDRAMADNLDALLDELHPGKKVIVWAHNFHIQRRRNVAHPERTMGTYVADRRGAEVYTVGLFMYRGGATRNDRMSYAIRPSASGSLESILHRAPWQQSFVDFSQAKREAGTEWMWTPIPSLSWGLNLETIVPRDEYDGVIFIDTVHVPVYLLY